MQAMMMKVMLGLAAGAFACTALLHAILLISPPPGTAWLHFMDFTAATVTSYSCAASLARHRMSEG
jgi:hypothetical protein